MESRLLRLIEPTTQLDSRRKIFSNASLMQMIVPLFFEQLLTMMVGIAEYTCLWTHEYSRECVDRIGGFFLPQKNAELQTALKAGTVINDDYLELPRKVIVRICESIDRWTKEGGADGYFNFVREFIIPEDMLRRRFLVEDRFLSGSIE